MASTVKAAAPARLSESETLNSFLEWRNTLEFYLKCDKDFGQFLAPGFRWQRTSASGDHRGCKSADVRNQLDRMLGVIASFAPSFLHGDITEDSESLADIYNFIREYFNFTSSEVSLLKFTELKREVVDGRPERPQHLYRRIRQFVRDNLLRRDGTLRHNNSPTTQDEQFSPTLERLLVIKWLELIHS